MVECFRDTYGVNLASHEVWAKVPFYIIEGVSRVACNKHLPYCLYLAM